MPDSPDYDRIYKRCMEWAHYAGMLEGIITTIMLTITSEEDNARIRHALDEAAKLHSSITAKK